MSIEVGWRRCLAAECLRKALLSRSQRPRALLATSDLRKNSWRSCIWSAACIANLIEFRQPGGLATITSTAEHDFVRGLIPPNSPPIWLGAVDQSENRWVWQVFDCCLKVD